LIPAAETFEKATDGDADLLQALSNACDAAAEGTKSTEEIVAGKGRARYLAERAKGHPDPGAVAVTIWLRAVAYSIKSISSYEFRQETHTTQPLGPPHVQTTRGSGSLGVAGGPPLNQRGAKRESGGTPELPRTGNREPTP